MRGTINYCRLGVQLLSLQEARLGRSLSEASLAESERAGMGGSFIYSLLLFILCLVFAEGCISRTHSLGPTMLWKLSLPSPARSWVR